VAAEGIVGDAKCSSTGPSPGMDKMQALLDKHEYLNCVSLKTGAFERVDGALPNREDPFNGNVRDNSSSNHMN
jgi:hypothetical protein